jgi:RNA polymerase sigma-70 factor (ECF subfamily)
LEGSPVEKESEGTAATNESTALVRAAAKGDRDAFGELFRRFGRAVHGTLLASLPPSDADDLVQDVFLHAMKHLGDLRDPLAFGAWICTIARHRAIDHHRQRTAREELPDDLMANENPGVDAEARDAIEAIQSLPEAYRETLALRLVEGMSGREIAALTGLTPESVRVNLHRGFRMLRERLGIRES